MSRRRGRGRTGFGTISSSRAETGHFSTSVFLNLIDTNFGTGHGDIPMACAKVCVDKIKDFLLYGAVPLAVIVCMWSLCMRPLLPPRARNWMRLSQILSLNCGETRTSHLSRASSYGTLSSRRRDGQNLAVDQKFTIQLLNLLVRIRM